MNSKGRAIIGWDEILEGDGPTIRFGTECDGYELARHRGRYCGCPTKTYRHHDPGATCYLAKYQGNPATEPLTIGGYLPLDQVYAYEPTPAQLTPAEQKYILGVQGNVWTEYVPTPERVEYMVWPRALALAEISWMPAGPRNFEDFALRLKNHLPRLDRLNVRYAKRLFDITATTQPNEQGQVQVKLSKLDSDSRIFYTLNGKEPNERSTEYTRPITLSKTTTLRAITQTGGQLTQTFTLHKAKNKSYTYAIVPDADSDAQKTKLTDGVRGAPPPQPVRVGLLFRLRYRRNARPRRRNERNQSIA